MDNENLVVHANVPAKIDLIPESTFNLHYQNNELVTHVKLRVFYKGMTKDRRLFTEEFSSKLLSSLPQTPVVGYFDEEQEDFIGHNHTQFIYGYVPETAKFGFETDKDGTVWAVTDIVLFTGRKDNIGKVAQKIIGKQHSLELDSNSMKYSIHRDAAGQLQHIELTDGKFIGLSVLGDAQSPAFEGSSFFEEVKTQEFAKCYKEMADNARCFISNEFVANGGEEVNQEITTKPEIELGKFMRVTYNELQKKIYDALCVYWEQEVYIVQWSPENDLVFMDLEDGQYYKLIFSVETDGTVKLGQEMPVKPRFLTEEEINAMEDGQPKQLAENEVAATIPANTPVPEKEQEGIEDMTSKEEEVKPVEKVEEATTIETEEIKNAQIVVETVSQVSSTQEIVDTKEIVATGEGIDEQKEEGIFITEGQRIQIENDRKELEEYRKERKFSIIEKYTEFLTSQEKNDIAAKIDAYSIDELETALTKISMEKVLKEKTKNNVGSYGIRTTPKIQSNPNSDKLADLVGHYKGK